MLFLWCFLNFQVNTPNLMLDILFSTSGRKRSEHENYAWDKEERLFFSSPHATSLQNSSSTLCVPIFCGSRASPLLWNQSSTSCNSALCCFCSDRRAMHLLASHNNSAAFPLLNQHQVYPRHLCFFLTYPVYYHTIIFPAKDTCCKASVLRLKLVYLFYRCWKVNAFIVNTINNRKFAWSLRVLSTGWRK